VTGFASLYIISSGLSVFIITKLPITLGLDLQGGMHLVLEVEAQKAVESHLERVVEDLKYDLRNDKIRYPELKRRDTEGLDITLMRPVDRDAFYDLIETDYSDFEIEQGVNQETGLALELTLKPEARNQIMKLATDQALETIRNRVDQFGVREPVIQKQGEDQIVVQLPGVDQKRATTLIGQTAQLTFQLVREAEDFNRIISTIDRELAISQGLILDEPEEEAGTGTMFVPDVERSIRTLQ